MSNSNGNSKRKPGRPKDPQREQRVEQIRGLLRLGLSTGDIKRLCAKKWNLSRKTIPAYIAAARKRNREVIEKTEDEHLADSVSYWAKILQEAESTISRSQQRMTDAYEMIDRANSILDEADASIEEKQLATDRRTDGVRILEHCRKTIYSSRKESMECRRELDKLLGCHAPTKIAQTTSDGKDVDRSAQQALTHEQLGQRILELGEKLNLRMKNGSNPSAN